MQGSPSSVPPPRFSFLLGFSMCDPTNDVVARVCGCLEKGTSNYSQVDICRDSGLRWTLSWEEQSEVSCPYLLILTIWREVLTPAGDMSLSYKNSLHAHLSQKGVSQLWESLKAISAWYGIGIRQTATFPRRFLDRSLPSQAWKCLPSTSPYRFAYLLPCCCCAGDATSLYGYRTSSSFRIQCFLRFLLTTCSTIVSLPASRMNPRMKRGSQSSLAMPRSLQQRIRALDLQPSVAVGTPSGSKYCCSPRAMLTSLVWDG